MPRPIVSVAVCLTALAMAPSALQAQERKPTSQEAGPFAELHYRCIGPSRGGRVTTVAGVVPQPGTFYMGSVGGGVWQTNDFGQSWRNVSDGFFANSSIGAIAVAPSDPDVVWVGTGSDGLRSNVIPGRGLYRSTDGGGSWQHMGLPDVGHVGAVEIHPEDPLVVYVAAIGNAFAPNPERGVFRTRDGGRRWEKVLYVSETCGAVDLELNPANPDEIYASAWHAERKPWTIISGGDEGGVYKSVDGGDSWSKLEGGLPQGVVGKSDLAVSFADPNRLYVLIEAPPGEGGVYRSDDRGTSFELISTQRGLLDRPFYYCNIEADPTDADVLYVNATSFYKSDDAGESWRRLRTPHGDNHDIWIHPEHPEVFIQSNDGGANVTMDGGKTWSTQRNQLTAELYQVAVDDRFPYWVYAGQQDNSTIRVPSLPPYPAPAGPTSFWQSVGGCETGPAVPKPGDPDIVYANCKGRFGVFNMRTGQERHYYVGAANMYGHNPRDLKYRFQRVSPIIVSPHDPGVVYHASQYLHRTKDEGVNWETISPDLTANEPDKQVISGQPITRDITGEEFYSCIYEVAESPLQQGLIWVGANDGPVHVTRDGGTSWADVTPSDLPSGGRVQTIEPSPHRPGKAYLCVLRYQLGDCRPHVFRTEDYGASWQRLTNGDNGVPLDTPVRVVREDPDREGLLYLGTELGMFVSFDDGAHWQPLQQNLPVTPVTDLVVHRKDLVLSTMGRSFWILDDVSPLHGYDEDAASADVHLFAPRPAYRMRYRPSRTSGTGSPEYPSPGALVHYRLGSQPEGEVVLEILDGEGDVVRRIASGGGTGRPGRGDPAESDAQREGMRGPRGMRFSPPARLPTEAGMHRFRWDLRRSGADGRGRGPMVVPGTYRVRLTVGEAVRTAELEVRIDPRVAAEGITLGDLQAQETLSLKVLDVSARARDLQASVQRRVRAGSKDEALAGLAARLTTAPGRYMTPMLIDQLRYLQGMIDRADQRPGGDAYERLAELEAELKSCEDEFERLR